MSNADLVISLRLLLYCLNLGRVLRRVVRKSCQPSWRDSQPQQILKEPNEHYCDLHPKTQVSFSFSIVATLISSWNLCCSISAMPSEFLNIPPAYTLVGIYRLFTDPFIRQPVLNKIKHASIRGIIIGVVYGAGSWRVMDWFVRKFLLGRGGWFFGFGGARGKVGEAVKESVGGLVKVGFGRFSINVDLVLCELS